MKKVTLSVLLAIAVSTPAMAQTCKPNSIPVSHPQGQYLDNGDGTVTDIVNGLMWQKCSLGQVYSNGLCAGVPSNHASWEDALQAANYNGSFAGHNDWRLPNIMELGSLVERSCVAPSINLTSFPSTPSAIYWTNTMDAQGVNASSGIKGRVIDFTNGTEFLTDVNSHRLIRMVRKL